MKGVTSGLLRDKLVDGLLHQRSSAQDKSAARGKDVAAEQAPSVIGQRAVGQAAVELELSGAAGIILGDENPGLRKSERLAEIRALVESGKYLDTIDSRELATKTTLELDERARILGSLAGED
jgi:hypothetical protein